VTVAAIVTAIATITGRVLIVAAGAAAGTPWHEK